MKENCIEQDTLKDGLTPG